MILGPRQPTRDADGAEGARDAESAAAMELAAFGLDENSDEWLHVFRDAKSGEAPADVGAFKVLGEAGRGGQGVVYRARCTRTGRDVALKRLDGDSRARSEIVATAGLAHPAIVRVTGVDDGRGGTVLKMDWVDGVPFTQWADGIRGGTGDSGSHVRAIVDVLLHVCDAVSHAHQRGVLHRDIKPSNILVEVRAGPPATATPRLLDFGLARCDDGDGAADAMTRAGEFVGTLAYAAPELLARGPRSLDARADVYSLGVVLYRAAAGRMPFDTEVPLADAVRLIQEHTPAAPSSFATGLDRDFDAVALRALAKRPEDRYQSVDAFAGDLRRWLRGEPVLARAPGALDRAWLWMRRRPALAAAVAAALIIAAGAGIVSSILSLQLAQQTRDANSARRDAELVTSFLRDTLGAARPANSGPDVSVLEVLREAGTRADAELAAQPKAAAEVHYTVGYTLRSLWKFSEAIPHLEKAVALSREHYGNQREQTARCLVALGTCLSNTGEGDSRAVETQQEALKIRRALTPGDDALVAESLMRTGYALFRSPPVAADGTRTADWPAAAAHLNDALAMYRRLYGEAHRDVGSCLHNIAYMHAMNRDDAAAAEWFTRAVASFRAAGDLRDPYYAECLTGYGPVLTRLGKTREALDVTLELMPLSFDLYGREAGAAQTMRAATLYLKLDDPASAAEVLTPLVGPLPIGSRVLTADEALAAARLAACWRTLGRADDAADLMSRARDALHDTLGPDHARTRQAEMWWEKD